MSKDEWSSYFDCATKTHTSFKLEEFLRYEVTACKKAFQTISKLDNVSFVNNTYDDNFGIISCSSIISCSEATQNVTDAFKKQFYNNVNKMTEIIITTLNYHIIYGDSKGKQITKNGTILTKECSDKTRHRYNVVVCMDSLVFETNYCPILRLVYETLSIDFSYTPRDDVSSQIPTTVAISTVSN